jgi:hypothetical protein
MNCIFKARCKEGEFPNSTTAQKLHETQAIFQQEYCVSHKVHKVKLPSAVIGNGNNDRQYEGTLCSWDKSCLLR